MKISFINKSPDTIYTSSILSLFNFNNKGLSACCANSMKAYEAEAQVINKIEQFICNEEQLYSKLQALNTTSIEFCYIP